MANLKLYKSYIEKGGLLVSNIIRTQTEILENNLLNEETTITPRKLLIIRSESNNSNELEKTLAKQIKSSYNEDLSLLEAIEDLIAIYETRVTVKYAEDAMRKRVIILRESFIKGDFSTSRSRDRNIYLEHILTMIDENKEKMYVDFDFDNELIEENMMTRIEQLSKVENNTYSFRIQNALRKLYIGDYANYDNVLCESVASVTQFLDKKETEVQNFERQAMDCYIEQVEYEDHNTFNINGKNYRFVSHYELYIGGKLKGKKKSPEFSLVRDLGVSLENMCEEGIEMYAIRTEDDIDFLMDIMKMCRINDGFSSIYNSGNTCLYGLCQSYLLFVTAIEATKLATPKVAEKLNPSFKSKKSKKCPAAFNYLSVVLAAS